MKRFFDLLFSIIVLVLFLPIGVLIASLIVLDSKGGVFFRQQRVGKDGVLFYVLKFRSMHLNSAMKGTLTVGDDARITRVGSLIRKVKLDEFPQFMNVVLGDMSIVGPRPEVTEFVALYSEEQRKVLSVRPGITDEASLAYFEESKLTGEHHIKHVDRRVARQQSAQQIEPLARLVHLPVGFEQAFSDQRQIGRVLRFNAFPCLNRRLGVLLRNLQITEQHIGAHAQAVVRERLCERRTRALGTRLHDFARGQLTEEIGDLLLV